MRTNKGLVISEAVRRTIGRPGGLAQAALVGAGAQITCPETTCIA
jgi:hypothetical protein